LRRQKYRRAVIIRARLARELMTLPAIMPAGVDGRRDVSDKGFGVGLCVGVKAFGVRVCFAVVRVERWENGVVGTNFRLRIVNGAGVAVVAVVPSAFEAAEWTEKEMKPSCLGADEDEEGCVAMRLENGTAAPVKVGESGVWAVAVAVTAWVIVTVTGELQDMVGDRNLDISSRWDTLLRCFGMIVYRVPKPASVDIVLDSDHRGSGHVEDSYFLTSMVMHNATVLALFGQFLECCKNMDMTKRTGFPEIDSFEYRDNSPLTGDDLVVGFVCGVLRLILVVVAMMIAVWCCQTKTRISVPVSIETYLLP
jgi:hypothetical protein